MNRFVALLRTLVSRTLAIFRTSSAERDMDEELQTHLNLATEENLRNGMTPEVARSAALRAFGGVTQTRESYRTQRGLPFLPVLLQDLRFGFRQLWKSPGFALVAIGSLALGIGASVAVFSVVRAVLLDPYPYKDADRMIHVELRDKSTPHGRLLPVTSTEFKDLQQLPAVDDVFLMDNSRQALTGDSLPISVNVGSYSANLFTYMGVPPLLGREFSPADAPGGNAGPVAVLSYLFWKKQYGGQPGIVGKNIELDHTLYAVIGVANPRFTWGDSDVYLPGNFKADPHYYMLPFIKLKPGATHASLIAQLQPLVDRYAKQDPTNFPQGTKAAIVTLNEEVLGNFQSALLTLFGAVLLLLLIGCANVSILMLARGVARQHEFAVRSSVGAGRGRILRQLLTESIMLSLTGAALGVLLAYRGVDLITTNLPMYSFPHEASAAIHVNATVLLFAVGIALLTGILFGLSPAWQLSVPRPPRSPSPTALAWPEACAAATPIAPSSPVKLPLPCSCWPAPVPPCVPSSPSPKLRSASILKISSSWPSPFRKERLSLGNISPTVRSPFVTPPNPLSVSRAPVYPPPGRALRWLPRKGRRLQQSQSHRRPGRPRTGQPHHLHHATSASPLRPLLHSRGRRPRRPRCPG
jgi:hypothetical protein